MSNFIRSIRNMFKKLDCSAAVTIVSITKLGPCKDRLDNYVSFYGNREFTQAQFMGLRNITHSDKLWVAFRLMPKENTGKAAGEIAKTVLHVYESEYPNDNRLRLAVEAAIAGTVTKEIRDAASAAAVNATSAADAAVNAASAATYAADAAAYAAYAAYAAAYATIHATACTPHVSNAAYATYAAYAAYATYAAYADSRSDINAAYAVDRHVQEKRIRTIILRYWK